MRLTLLVDGDEFRESLCRDIPQARRQVLVQALTFEGDRAGRGVAELISTSKAADRRLVVDCFTKHWINDKWIHNPRHWFDRELHREVRDTERMLRDLGGAGVGVKFTNPLGAFMLRGPVRNHKKLVILDGRVAYIGGINFSDHNFAWRDVMLRMEDPEIASFLAADFEATWRGENQAAVREFPGITLHLLDGRRNAAMFGALLGLLEGARERIDVECGYLTPPFSGWLRQARARGVAVRVVTPAPTNWPAVRDHVRWESARAGIDLRLYQGRMIHLKTILVDDRALVIGSANFDLWSYWFQQEVMGIVSNAGVIADFRRRVLEPDLALSRACDGSVGHLRGRFATLKLKALEGVSLFFNG